MWLCRYFFFFVIFSTMGWIYETCYVTIRTGVWSNRGFLYGPVVPIYGAGGVGLMFVLDLINAYLGGNYTWWQIFLLSYLGSIVLEYSTSYVLEKLFHARWWDYTRMPLNINGRVCLPYSIGFGVAGLLVTYIIIPATNNVTDWITPILYELFALLTMGVLSADLTLTVSALTGFDKNVAAMEETVNAHMEDFVRELQEKRVEVGEALAEDREALTSREAFEKLREERRLEREKRIGEERSRFAAMHLEHSMDHMSHLQRSAISRVHSFSRPRVEKVQVDGALERIRTRLSRKRPVPKKPGKRSPLGIILGVLLTIGVAVAFYWK